MSIHGVQLRLENDATAWKAFFNTILSPLGQYDFEVKVDNKNIHIEFTHIPFMSLILNNALGIPQKIRESFGYTLKENTDAFVKTVSSPTFDFNNATPANILAVFFSEALLIQCGITKETLLPMNVSLDTQSITIPMQNQQANESAKMLCKTLTERAKIISYTARKICYVEQGNTQSYLVIRYGELLSLAFPSPPKLHALVTTNKDIISVDKQTLFTYLKHVFPEGFILHFQNNAIKAFYLDKGMTISEGIIEQNKPFSYNHKTFEFARCGLEKEANKVYTPLFEKENKQPLNNTTALSETFKKLTMT